MEAIVLTDDELRVIEKRFGPEVRQMGPWNSDGTFGYSSISVIAVEKAAEELEDPNLTSALSCLKGTPDGSRHFIELLRISRSGSDRENRCGIPGTVGLSYQFDDEVRLPID